MIILCGSADGTFVPKRGAMRPENKYETPATSRTLVKEGRVAECRVCAITTFWYTRVGCRKTERLVA